MLQGKYRNEYSMGRLGVLLLEYKDFWLPLCLFITFPLWILPAIVYYTGWRIMQVWKFWLRLGSKIIQGESSPQLSYAILKGNGRYLRDQSQNVHKKQFYDYTSRRFMSINQLDPQSKIIELQCDSTVGLQFFAEQITSGIVVGVQSSRQILRSINNSMGLIVHTDYSLSGKAVGYDCMLLFNFKKKVKTSGEKPDLITILNYCRYHMDRNGYLVFGDYFQDGELATFVDIFEGFNFRVAQQELITKNIEYARKLANKKNISFEQKILDTIFSRLDKIFGKINKDSRKQFIVLILQKTE